MKTVLISGINGFLGSQLAFSLSGKFRVIGLEYSIENLYRIRDKNYLVYPSSDGIPADVFKQNDIHIVIHTATLYGRNEESINTMLKTNVILAHQLLHLSVQSNCEIFINTDTLLPKNTSEYSITKSHFVDWMKYYLGYSKTKLVNIRLEHFYGPGASENNFVVLMMTKLLQNQPSIETTIGTQERRFLYIDDVISAFILLLNSYERFGAYQEFEVASSRSLSIKDLLIRMKKVTGSTSHLDFGKIALRKNEIMRIEANLEPIEKLGWNETHMLDLGLNILRKYIVENMFNKKQ